MSESTDTPAADGKPFKILTLDGGGAKGVYTLGFLTELEAAVKAPLCEFFDAIYGTSTGAIIAALLGLGKSARECLDLYLEHVPTILKPFKARSRSKALALVANHLFGEQTFESFKTFVGIVSTNWTMERPLIFKSSVEAAYSMKATFAPGFGCTISKAVQSSCSASPFFAECMVDLGQAGIIEARDGGFAANNPALFAITDALKAFKRRPQDLRLLSLGVGHYPKPKKNLLWRIMGWVFEKIPSAHLLQKTLSVNANTTETLVRFLCDTVSHLRISDRFDTPELATDFLEYRREKLELLKQKGRDSFGANEAKVLELLK